MTDQGERRLLLPTLALLTTITAVVSSLGAPLVPSIAEAYDVRLTTAQWSLTASLLVGAVATPVVGRFASGRLRRPTILAGLVVVTTGCAIAIAPPSYGVLVAGRAMQGIGMTLVPLAIAVARDALHGERMARAIAFLSVTTVAGAGLGYPLTALVAEVGGLAAAYGLGTLLVGATLVMNWRYLPGSDEPASMRVDWAGAVLLSLGMVAVLLAVSEGEVWGWTSAATLVLGAVGLVLLVVWAVWTLRSPTPLIDLRMAVRPGIAAPNLVAFVAGLGMYSLLTLSVVLVRADQPGFGLGLPVLVAGLILVPYSLMSVLGNQIARQVRTRLGPAVLLPTGCLVFFATTVYLAFAHDHLWQLFLAMTLGGVGSGFTFSSLAVLMVPHLPQAETGSAMSFNQVLRYLGFTIGSALSVALMAAYGGGDHGFTATLLTFSTIFLAAALGAVVLDRRPTSSG